MRPNLFQCVCDLRLILKRYTVRIISNIPREKLHASSATYTLPFDSRPNQIEAIDKTLKHETHFSKHQIAELIDTCSACVRPPLPPPPKKKKGVSFVLSNRITTSHTHTRIHTHRERESGRKKKRHAHEAQLPTSWCVHERLVTL